MKLGVRVRGLGLFFGLKGSVDDYRFPLALNTRHWQAGLTNDGKLFVNFPGLGYRTSNTAIGIGAGAEVNHKLTLSFSSSTRTLSLSITAGNDLESANFETMLNHWAANQLVGNVGLAARSSNSRFKNFAASGSSLVEHSDQVFGPIAWSQYSMDEATSVVKINVQMVPVTGTAVLELMADGTTWTQVDSATIDPLSRTALFRLEGWNVEGKTDTPYRIGYTWSGTTYHYEGKIRKNPTDQDAISIATFSCDHGYAFPLPGMVRNVITQDPDLVFFAGDQIYEHYGSFGFVDVGEGSTHLAMLDYLRKWFLFGWTWRDVLKDRPSVIVPDDHDVFMGNLWGEGGKPMREGTAEAAGGYKMPPAFVNAVQRTQTDHMSDAFDPTPVEQGIGVYYHDFQYGGISLAVIEDRKWKSGPNNVLTGAWKTAGPEQLDSEVAELLGPRQEAFLIDWASRTQSDDLRVVMSATIFAHASTNVGNQLKKDQNNCDSNGWPKRGRDRALRPLMNNPNTVMLHGDQHMGILVKQGIDQYNDGPYAFMVPGTTNGYPRAWWPQGPEADISTWTGDFEDDFGNKFTVFAAANPDVGANTISIYQGDAEDNAHRKGSGYGVLTYQRAKARSPSSITFNMFRFNFDAANPKETDQFTGFPQSFVLDNGEERRRHDRRNLEREATIGSWLPGIGNGEVLTSELDDEREELLATLKEALASRRQEKRKS